MDFISGLTEMDEGKEDFISGLKEGWGKRVDFISGLTEVDEGLDKSGF